MTSKDYMVTAKPSKKRKIIRTFAFSLAFVGVFVLGVNFGNGRIIFKPSANTANSSLPASLDYASVNRIYQSLKQNYDGKLTQQQLEDGLKHGLASATKDPYTSYFTAKEAKDFNDQLNNSFSGVGAQLGLDDQGNLEVIAPIANMPADKAGLKAKDLITEINGQSTTGLSVDDAVSKIRGKPGTKVKLSVVRNKNQPLSFVIIRQTINLPSVTSKTLDGNIGYIQISSFANDTYQLTQKAVEKFKAQKVKGLIVDMRNNPGGLLDAAVNISSLWLPQGTQILQEKTGGTVVQTYQSTGNDIAKGIPTVVLINEGSASASEITAGALRDNKVAYIIGEKSYGKGVVQQLINLKDGSQLKVTVASWYRPNGQNINHRGITPDQVVKITETDSANKNDPQLQAAEAYLNKQ
jgi:carboxyl-terminal processing protease